MRINFSFFHALLPSLSSNFRGYSIKLQSAVTITYLAILSVNLCAVLHVQNKLDILRLICNLKPILLQTDKAQNQSWSVKLRQPVPAKSWFHTSNINSCCVL